MATASLKAAILDLLSAELDGGANDGELAPLSGVRPTFRVSSDLPLASFATCATFASGVQIREEALADTAELFVTAPPPSGTRPATSSEVGADLFELAKYLSRVAG